MNGNLKYNIILVTLGFFLLLLFVCATCEEKDKEENNICDRECLMNIYPYYSECYHEYWYCLEEDSDNSKCLAERERCYNDTYDIFFACYSKCNSCYYEFYICVEDCGGSSEECGEAYDDCFHNYNYCVKDWYPNECLSNCGSNYYKCELNNFEIPEIPNFDRLHECVDELEACLLDCF